MVLIVWTYTVLSVIIVSLISLIGVLTLAIKKKASTRYYSCLSASQQELCLETLSYI